jgi:hypothetical protein
MEIKNYNKASLICISGGLLSGKDLTGSIIQYLSLTKNDESSWRHDNFPIEKCIKENINLSSISHWDIKKFADKLKDITCMLLSCTRSELEDREFKESSLGDEWSKFYSWNNENLEWDEVNKEEYDNLIVLFPESVMKKEMTPRKLLQVIGTDLFRKQLNSKIWVNALFSGYDSKKSKWIITDCRFPDELEYAKKRNGITIKINRNLSLRFPKEWNAYINSSYYSIYIDKSKTDLYIEENFIKYLQTNFLYNDLYKKLTHESETALCNYNDNYDYIIDNNSDIPTLINNIREILIKENII